MPRPKSGRGCLPQGGMISLTLSCQDGEICFKVQDQGMGISPEDQKHLFEPFQRGTNVGNITGTIFGSCDR